jgi:uncharacterized protein YutE (UPF0331/DUF86 family)
VALREIEAAGRDAFLGDPRLQAQVERHLQLAIQAAIDIAVHLLAEDSAGPPEDYGSAFVMLAGRGTLPDELAERLRSAAGLRNILVHAYLDVDPGRLWTHLANLSDFEAFSSAILRSLDG